MTMYRLHREGRRVTRFDGHSYTENPPTGAFYLFTQGGAAGNNVFTPPADAVAMRISGSANLRLRLDNGVATATNGFSLPANEPTLIYISPGVPLNVYLSASSTVQIQWLGSV